MGPTNKSFAVLQDSPVSPFVLTHLDGRQKIFADEYSLMLAIGNIMQIRARKKVKRKKK